MAIGANLNDGSGKSAGHVRVYQYNTTTKKWTQLGADIDGEGDGQSGSSVSISSDGKTVAIGAPENNENGKSAGHVLVYQYNTATKKWKQAGSDLDGEASV